MATKLAFLSVPGKWL